MVKNYRPKICPRCGITYKVFSPSQKSCKDCSPILRREKHRPQSKDWAKKYRLNNKVKANNYSRKAKLKYKLENQARRKIMYQVEKGRIVRPEVCSECLKSCKPEAHHADYTKPLEVKWFCKLCHEAEHHFVNDLNKLMFNSDMTLDEYKDTKK